MIKISFRISTINYPGEIKNKLLTINSININEDKMNDYTFFNIDSNNEDYCTLENYLANIIAEIIVDKMEFNIVDEIILHKYSEFNSQERLKIEKFTRDYLKKHDKLLQKINIISRLIHYFAKNNELNVEGFIRFRLKDYIQQLKFAVDRAVDDYIIEKEYNEFIDLLRYFIEMQEPQIPLVHVLQNEDKSFEILNSKKEKIQTEYLEGYISEILDDEVNDEDLLISTLINLSPGKIILHFDDFEIEEAVRNIFADKVMVCIGCDFCGHHERNT